MTLTPEGGAAIPVSVTTTRKVQGGAAIPVYGYMTAPTDGRPALGGPALPVRVLTAADLKENGGMWTLEGRPHAMPVYTAPATTTVMGGPALAVYPVNAWPTVPVVPPVPAWAPTDIAGLALWLKADAGLFQDVAKTTPATADTDPVGAWADQSANGRDVTQATAGLRPTLKLNIQNGKPTVRFDGAGDYLVSAGFVTAQPMTFYMVANMKNTSAYLFDSIDGINRVLMAHGIFDVGKMALYAGGFAFTSYVRAVPTGMVLFKVVVNGATSKVLENAVQQVAGDASTNACGGLTLGARFSFSDTASLDLCEFVMFPSVLSAGDDASMNTYLNGRWAVY